MENDEDEDDADDDEGDDDRKHQLGLCTFREQRCFLYLGLGLPKMV